MTDQVQSFNQPAPRPPLASGLAGQAPVTMYPDEAPPPQPTGTMPDRASSPFFHLDTAYLNRVQKDLRTNIPSDPTNMAHITTLLRVLIQYDLSNPDRIAADKAAADAAAAQAAEKVRADMAARHEAEKAAVAPDGAALTPEGEKQMAELAARHEAEVAAHDRAQALADLTVQQAEEARAFAAHQAEQRAALAPA